MGSFWSPDERRTPWIDSSISSVDGGLDRRSDSRTAHFNRLASSLRNTAILPPYTVCCRCLRSKGISLESCVRSNTILSRACAYPTPYCSYPKRKSTLMEDRFVVLFRLPRSFGPVRVDSACHPLSQRAERGRPPFPFRSVNRQPLSTILGRQCAATTRRNTAIARPPVHLISRATI